MPTEYGNCGDGNIYNAYTPDLPRLDPAAPIEPIPRRDRPYGYDWPGIGPPPRELKNMAPAERYRRRPWSDDR